MKTVFTGVSGPSAIGANDQDLGAGSEVGEYRIERVLGKGGFGTVYGAVQPVIGKQVAIKVLARKYSADPDIVSRFIAEARAVNQIRHRNIIDIFSFGQLPDGRHYYVMEHLEGSALDAYLRDNGAMPLDEAVPVLRAIARALDAAHAKGIAHRDLKPENIFLAHDPDGGVFPKLLDFGIAKLMTPDDDVRHKTNTGVPIGTPYYMSPEQCRGKDVDHRTDIYSFGIVAYRVLTGAFPFEGDDYMELLFKQVNEEPPPPSSRNPVLPASVDEAIAWMMRKDRAQRPPNVIEGVNALDPTAVRTPSIPTVGRGGRPTVSPKNPFALALEKTSTPDALAATFTPEFERPVLPVSTIGEGPPAPPRGSVEPASSPAVPARRNRLWLPIAGITVVGAAAAAFALTRDPAPAAAPTLALPPPTSPAPAPAPEPAPAGTVSSGVETVPVTAAKDSPVDVAPPPSGSATKQRKAGIKKPATQTSEKPTTPPAPKPDVEPTNQSRDTIQLGSDAFK